MLNQNQINQIETKFEQAVGRMGDRKALFLDPMEALSPQETVCMKFLIGFMPVSDMANYDGALLLKFVRHALIMRELTPWGKDIPEELFLNFVLFYRVNNENVEFCRDSFYREISSRIEGKNMTEAALEVNYWCFEKATYQPSDDRTASPVTVIKNALGRCGEESTLTVTAYRSVGIPARQCYVPRWSHCDDNHAWVEIWVDGQWHYLGACEPQPELNKGWFTYAASRAMLVHSRAFSSILNPSEVIAENGCLTEVNNLKTYADTAPLTVTVIDSNGKLACDAEVQFEVLNYAELYPVATVHTDENGKAVFLTGLGDLMVHANLCGKIGYCKADLRQENSVTIQLRETEALPPEEDIDIFPPEGTIRSESHMCTDRLRHHQEKLENAQAKREQYMSTFFGENEADIFARQFGEYHDRVSPLLQKARGNRHEMLAFLQNGTELDLKVRILETLTEKDMLDFKADVLNEHIAYAKDYESAVSSDIFDRYLLCPRVSNESLYSYRAFLFSFFAGQKETFRDDPALIQAYIDKNIADSGDLDYDTLLADAKGLLQIKIGSLNSKKVLFVAICRAFGIPARLDPVLHEPQYYKNGSWVNARQYECNKAAQPTGTLTLAKPESDSLEYEQNFTVAVLTNGIFQSIGCESSWAQNRLTCTLAPGLYRVITTNRQIDGSILSKLFHCRVNANETTALSIRLRKDELVARLKNIRINDHTLTDTAGEEIQLSSLVRAVPVTILAILEIGAEPTEHLLNEMIELKAQCKNKPVIFISHQKEKCANGTLTQALAALPSCKLYFCNESDFPDNLFDEVKSGDHRLPLATVIDSRMNARFAFANYNVGTAKLLLKIAEI